MKISFFSKIFVGYLLVILMLSLACLLAFSHTSRNLYRETISENLKDVVVVLASDAERAIDRKDVREFDRRAKEMAGRLKIRLTLVDTKGAVMADSDENPLAMENHRNRPEIVEALSGKTGRVSRFSSTRSQEALYVAVPIGEDGTIKGVLRASRELKDINMPSRLAGQMSRIAIFLSLLALCAAFLIARSSSKPIGRLRDAARRLASGDFGTRVFLSRNDEFKELADTFNSMSQEIRTSFEELARQRHELKSIIDSLREGLVVIDRRGAIVYCNRSLKQIAGQEQTVEGKLYWEVFNQGSFIELMEKVKGNNPVLTEETVIGDKTYLSSATRLEPQGEIVLVFHDITSMKQLERIKKDLVANVSHELRTPLTSIKGFAETLDDEVGEEQRRFVEIIRRNTDRLINIVEDLLLLSNLEEKGTELEVEEVDLRKLIDDTVRIFDHRAGQKGLLLKVDMPAEAMHMPADRFKLEQMLINLLDNAIKYTDAGEIRVALKQSDSAVTIEVHDTGIGISSDKIPRIFERFFVVDKSRSRKMGGTGLGLSIVKHIVLLHGGDIRVKSSPGGGTHFFVSLPVRPARKPSMP
jgi:two-component system phosphate regulon sensor histidine kinase PhoR